MCILLNIQIKAISEDHFKFNSSIKHNFLLNISFFSLLLRTNVSDWSALNRGTEIHNKAQKELDLIILLKCIGQAHSVIKVLLTTGKARAGATLPPKLLESRSALNF